MNMNKPKLEEYNLYYLYNTVETGNDKYLCQSWFRKDQLQERVNIFLEKYDNIYKRRKRYIIGNAEMLFELGQATKDCFKELIKE